MSGTFWRGACALASNTMRRESLVVTAGVINAFGESVWQRRWPLFGGGKMEGVPQAVVSAFIAYPTRTQV